MLVEDGVEVDLGERDIPLDLGFDGTEGYPLDFDEDLAIVGGGKIRLVFDDELGFCSGDPSSFVGHDDIET